MSAYYLTLPTSGYFRRQLPTRYSLHKPPLSEFPTHDQPYLRHIPVSKCYTTVPYIFVHSIQQYSKC